MAKQSQIVMTDQLEKIEKAIAGGEEAVSWIEKGWDCVDEYCTGIGFAAPRRCLCVKPGKLTPSSGVLFESARLLVIQQMAASDFPMIAMQRVMRNEPTKLLRL